MTTPPAVLITGASTGIGFACATRLDRLGYRVFAGIRKTADGDRLRAAASARLVPVRLDVTRDDEIRSAMATIREAVGPAGLAGLVNNAGVAVGGPIEFLPVAEIRHQLEVNVVGMVAVTQAALPLIRRARGRIVNMGSIAGKTVAPFVTPYCMSKHAVEAFTDGLRLELTGTGIQVSVVEPGPVQTPIWAKGGDAADDAERTLPPEALERYGGTLKLFRKLLALNDARGVSPERVADAVVDALESDAPRTRYLVGADARIRSFAAWILPDRVSDGVILGVIRRLERRLG